MASSPREISELSEDIGRLSASLAELNHEARGLAKVNVDKLESVHSPAGKLEMAEQGVGKTEVDNDVGKPESGRVPGGKLREDVAKAMAGRNSTKTDIGKVGKIEEDSDLLESRGAPGGKLKEDVAKAMEEEGVGKTGKVKKAEQGSDAGEGSVGKPNSQSKLEENVAKLEASFGPDGHAGIVGKTEGREFVSTPGSFTEVNQPGKLEEGPEASVGKPNSQSKLEENVAKLEASFGPDGHAGIVGKTEGREFVSTPGSFREVNQPGKLEVGPEASVGKTESENAPSRLKENACKLEQSFGPDGLAGIVGKTEGKEFVSTPGSFMEGKASGKLEEGNEPTMGKVESESKPGKLEGNVGKAEASDAPVGKAHSENAPGKLQENLGLAAESAGKGVGKGEAGNVGKTEANKLEKAETKPAEHPKVIQSKTTGEDEMNDRKKTVAGKNETYPAGKLGSGNVECVVHLASKGLAEAEYVEKLGNGDGLQLPANTVVMAAAEVTNTSVTEAFDVNLYLYNLPTAHFGRLVLYSPLIPSTHTLLSQNFYSIPAGTICVAGAQLQGKGRAGNVWASPKGCLMFSFTIQMTSGRLVPFLQYVVSLAVIEAVEEICKTSGIPAPDLRIKWPNDLYASGIKVGGVLCTSTYRAKTFNIVVGVGLNVGNREPTTCLDALIQDLDGLAAPIQQEELLAAIMNKFETLNSIFQDQGFIPLQDAYYRKWLHSGQSVVLEEKEPGSSSVSHVPVTIQGLTPTGYLLATDDADEEYELHPDGNSFDFLKGLVRQKLSA